jgi:hypothetical protein
MNRLFGRFDGDNDLDRVMLVRRNDPFTPPECGEASIPTDSSAACWSTEEGVTAVPEARSFNEIAALFKNFDLSVQSLTPVPSLLFDSHHGDYRRADIRRRR